MSFEEKVDVAEVELLFGVLRDSKGKHEAPLEEDLAEEGIVVTNLSIWSFNPAVHQENRLRPGRSWPETKFLRYRMITS